MKEIIDLFSSVQVINLDHRPDRLDSFVKELVRSGVPMQTIHNKVGRFAGIIPANKNGALGCILSHISIIRNAKKDGLPNVLVFEDDMMFVGANESAAIASQLSASTWDVFYLGYNSHESLEQRDTNLLRIRNCFSTHAIAYNHTVYDFILDAFDNMQINILDVWLRDVVQPQFECLGAFPIQCSQIPGKSDIEGIDVNYDFIMDRFRENTKHIKNESGITQDLLVSICIPTYEMQGRGYEFLDVNLQKIYEQTYKNVEVIVSDQANDRSIMQACAKWADRLKIVYAQEYNRGRSSMNMNNALCKASGALVKIMFEDDFFYTSKSLERMVQVHKEQNKMWYATSLLHTADGSTYYRPFTPQYHDNIHNGNNTMSAPTVILYVNTPDFVRFDDELVWLMDCDYYKRMALRHGPPHIIDEPHVVIRAWENNYSNLIDESKKTSEHEYINRKYGN